MNIHDGFIVGTRVRALLAIVFVTEDAEVAEGAEGIVTRNRPRGIHGLVTVRWDGLRRELTTMASNLEAIE